jgi:hypothetical protein
MKHVSFEQLALAEKNTSFDESDGSSLLAYPEFVAYFAALDTITEHHLIIGVHFVYGWMPRVPILHNPKGRIG